MGYIISTPIDQSNAKSLKVYCNSMKLLLHQPLKKTNFPAIKLNCFENFQTSQAFITFLVLLGLLQMIHQGATSFPYMENAVGLMEC